MLARAVPPPVHDFQGFTLNPPRQSRLKNGIGVCFFQQPQLELIHLTVCVKAGLLYEPKRRVASFCYELLKESHPTLSSHDLEALLDYYGTSIGVSFTLNFVRFNIQVPKKNVPFVFPIIVDLLKSSQFRQDNLEIFREKIFKDFEYLSQKPSYRAQQLMRQSYFGKSFAYGKILEHSDIQDITLSQLQDYYVRTCCAANIRVLIAGNFNETELTDVIAHFETIQQGEPMPPLPVVNSGCSPQRTAETWKNAKQTSLLLWRTAPTYTDACIYPFQFLITLYCNYFGSRLMQNLREKNGYTYGISGGVSYYENGALFSIESEVNNEKVAAALQECFAEMYNLCTELVTDKEMETVRNYLIGSALRSVDGTVSYMQTYTTWNDFGCNETRFQHYVDTLKLLTPSDIRSLARQWLCPDDFSVITVGAAVN